MTSTTMATATESRPVPTIAPEFFSAIPATAGPYSATTPSARPYPAGVTTTTTLQELSQMTFAMSSVIARDSVEPDS